MVYARVRLVAALLVAGVSQGICKEEATPAAPVSGDHVRGLLGVSRLVNGGLEIMIEDPSVDEPLKDFRALLAPARSSSKIIEGNPYVSAFAGYEEGRSVRHLQETCAPGDPFALSSSIYVDAEGCYTLVEETTDSYQVSGTGRVLAPFLFSTSTSYSSTTYSSSETYWVAGELFVGTDDNIYIDVDCAAEYVSGSHPTDADSWECFLGPFLVEISGDSFNLECGCEEDTDDLVGVTSTPLPAAALSSSPPEIAPTPFEVTPTLPEVVASSSDSTPTPYEPSPAVDFRCDGTDPFSIASELLPALEGCYKDTGAVNAVIWSQTGELVGGEIAVYTSYIDEEQNDPRWFVGRYAADTSDENLTATCVSLEAPSEAHPTSSSWACDFTGTQAFSIATDDQFRVVCDCEATSTIDTPSPQVASDPLGTNRGVERVSATAVEATLAAVSVTLLMA